jgi:hypothetical protein
MWRAHRPLWIALIVGAVLVSLVLPLALADRASDPG